jgi:CRISPR/Cas system-associated endonuclease Cas1
MEIVLSAKEMPEDDPFNQFMQDDAVKQIPKEETKSVKLFDQMQMSASLFNLLSQFESLVS